MFLIFEPNILNYKKRIMDLDQYLEIMNANY